MRPACKPYLILQRFILCVRSGTGVLLTFITATKSFSSSNFQQLRFVQNFAYTLPFFLSIHKTLLAICDTFDHILVIRSSIYLVSKFRATSIGGMPRGIRCHLYQVDFTGAAINLRRMKLHRKVEVINSRPMQREASDCDSQNSEKKMDSVREKKRKLRLSCRYFSESESD